MEILNKREVVVTTSSELKNILEGNNEYKTIYLDNDIVVATEILISDNIEYITINGTYNSNRNTLTINSNVTASSNNKKIVIKNIDIISTNTNGIIYVPSSNNYDVTVEYNNITFSGIKVSYNPYGTTRIIDSNIEVVSKENISSKEVCETAHVEIGGLTTITSSSNTQLFVFLNNVSPSIIFLENSRVNLSTDTMAFMNGTNWLSFTVKHDAEVNLITGNGFSAYTTHGAGNVLIDERATFNFIEKNHQRIPMWSIFGTLQVNEGANLLVINTYNSTPKDNYNIHFKGNSNKIIFNNPNSVVLYSKNAPVLYTNNNLTFTFNINRINLWTESDDVTVAGSIDYLPEYYWYKDKDNMYIKGVFNKNGTTINVSSLTAEDLTKTSSIDDFELNNKKTLSIGSSFINIDPIDNNSKVISGYAKTNSDVLIEYGNNSSIVAADDKGLFKLTLDSELTTNNIKITANTSTSFIYKTRVIELPFLGEITLAKANSNISYSFNAISYNPVILPKQEETFLSIIDSRVNSSPWKLFVHLSSPLTSKNNLTLLNAIIFKKLTDEEIILNEVPTHVFTGTSNNGQTLVTDVTFSKEKGLLLNLENNPLEINEEYNTKVIWSIEE